MTGKRYIHQFVLGVRVESEHAQPRGIPRADIVKAVQNMANAFVVVGRDDQLRYWCSEDQHTGVIGVSDFHVPYEKLEGGEDE